MRKKFSRKAWQIVAMLMVLLSGGGLFSAHAAHASGNSTLNVSITANAFTVNCDGWNEGYGVTLSSPNGTITSVFAPFAGTIMHDPSYGQTYKLRGSSIDFNYEGSSIAVTKGSVNVGQLLVSGQSVSVDGFVRGGNILDTILLWNGQAIDTSANCGKTFTSLPRQKLFVFVQGVTTSLSGNGIPGNATDLSFGSPNGIYATLSQKYHDAKFLMFSYTGSNSQGNPLAYTCPDTFSNKISYYVSLLKLQITLYLENHPDTDVYIVGHSMGGAIAFGLLADMVANGFINVKGGKIAGVVTMDSPLGGVPDGKLGLRWYLDATEIVYKFTRGCEETITWLPDQFYDLVDLTRVFDHAPYGTDDSLASVITGSNLSNLDIAKDARDNGVHLLTLENLDDYVYQPGNCPSLGKFPHSHFIDTQLINDQGSGSGIYGRAFMAITQGGATCSSDLNIEVNHSAVFIDQSMISNIMQLVEGGTPSA